MSSAAAASSLTIRLWRASEKTRAGETVLEIIYHPDEVPGAENDWALMVRSLSKERILGIVPALPGNRSRL
jgi:hypothetical protein